MKIYLLFNVLIVSVVASSFGQNIYQISDPFEIEGLILSAGDEVILADGTYSSDERILFEGIGTIDNPITFRAQSPGGVIFDNGLKMNIAGEYLIVDGFYWNGGYGASNFIQFRNGTSYAQNCVIQNCVIDGLIAEPGDAAEALAEGAIIKHRWVVLYGNHNSVINCSFMNKNTAGALVLAEYEYNASPDEVTNTRCDLVGHVISNNYFYNYEKIDSSLSNAGDSETIRIGTSEYQNVNSSALVKGNYFVQADGENEIITNKSMNNTYLNNTFRRCRGSLVLRHGSDAVVSGNYFLGENVEGTGGIRIADSNHHITNNYIQNCVTSLDNAVWNNGLTFVGGNTSSVQDCLTTSVSNAYQDVENINFSNNTFINTHSPIYFNATRDGADSVFGTVTNNLIFFENNNTNVTNVINGSYADIGSNLTFLGNVYNAFTSLGENATGFSEELITLTVNGEVFSHNQANKGASISEGPITDSMVGYGVGACFLNSMGVIITDSNCLVEAIEPVDSISVSSSIPMFNAEGGEVITDVSSNVNWIATSNEDWISVTPNSAEGSVEIIVTVTQNSTYEMRTGTVTFNQVNGDLSRLLLVNQEALSLESEYILINDGSATDNVTVEFVFAEEVTETKNNIAINSLDKNFDTQWSGQGIGGEIIYNLGGVFDLALVNFASTSGKTYEFQIWVSTTGTEAEDFVNAFPSEGNLVSNNSGEFENYLLQTVIENAKYVKIIGYGQPSVSSEWNTIKEIEFYRTDVALSTNEFNLEKVPSVNFYPNPVTNGKLKVTSSVNNFDAYKIFGLNGEIARKGSFEGIIDTSNISTGIYFVEISNENQKFLKKIIIE